RSRSNSVNTPGPYGYAGGVVHRSTSVTLPCTPSLKSQCLTRRIVGVYNSPPTQKIPSMRNKQLFHY
ncbi:MAG: hypothetical protein ABL884_12415, partial [Methyloglobulus sp.]